MNMIERMTIVNTVEEALRFITAQIATENMQRPYISVIPTTVMDGEKRTQYEGYEATVCGMVEL